MIALIMECWGNRADFALGMYLPLELNTPLWLAIYSHFLNKRSEISVAQPAKPSANEA